MADSDQQAKSKSPQAKAKHRDEHSEQHSKGQSSSNGAGSPKPSEDPKFHKPSGHRSPKHSGDQGPAKISPRPFEGPKSPKPPGSRSPKPSRDQGQADRRLPRSSKGPKSDNGVSPKPSRHHRLADNKSPSTEEPSGRRLPKPPKSQKPAHSKSPTAPADRKPAGSRSSGQRGGSKTSDSKRARPYECRTSAASKAGRPPEGPKLAAQANNTRPSKGHNLEGGKTIASGHTSSGVRSPRPEATPAAVVYPQGPSSQPGRQAARAYQEAPTRSKSKRCIRDPLVIAIILVTVVLLLVGIAIVAVYLSAGSAPQETEGASFTTSVTTEAARGMNTQTPTPDTTPGSPIPTTTTATTTARSPMITTSAPIITTEKLTETTTTITTTKTTTSIPAAQFKADFLLNCSLQRGDQIKDLCWLDHQTLVVLKSQPKLLVKYIINPSSMSCIGEPMELTFTPLRLACANGTMFLTHNNVNTIVMMKVEGQQERLDPQVNGWISTIAVNERYIAISFINQINLEIFTTDRKHFGTFGINHGFLEYSFITSSDLFLATTGGAGNQLIIYNIRRRSLTVIYKSALGAQALNTPLGVVGIEDNYILVAEKLMDRVSIWSESGVHVNDLEFSPQDPQFPGAMAVNRIDSKSYLAVATESGSTHHVIIYQLKYPLKDF